MAEYLGDDCKSQTLDNLNVQQGRVKNCCNAIQWESNNVPKYDTRVSFLGKGNTQRRLYW